MLSAGQIRAGRALAGLDQAGLAEAAGVSRSAVQSIERGTHKTTASTLRAIRAALEARGVMFVGEAESPVCGVLLLRAEGG